MNATRSTRDRILLIDAPTGIAGDMFLAALSDLGFDLSELESAFHLAGLTGLRLGSEELVSHGLRGRRLEIEAPDPQPHRALADCLQLVDALGLPDEPTALARRLFERLAQVEARLHGTSPEQVHFHEVGALDSLVDIAGAALGLHRLGVGQVHLRDLGLGRGKVDTQHGALPVPAPATLELLQGLPLRETGIDAELVTPTGALILAECARPLQPGFAWLPLRSAYGAGRRELPDRPNLLRLTLATAQPGPAGIGSSAGEGEAGGAQPSYRRVILPIVRCTIDDMNPERFSYLMERLLAAGVLDVHYRPLQMKKNRPGVEVEVLVEESRLDAAVEILFAETTTLGLRISREERLELPRELAELETPFGPVRVKVAGLPGGGQRVSPEHEDCARLAREGGVTLAQVEEAARAAWREREENR